MAGLSITGQMKVSTLQEGFLKEFGLKLRVYDGREFADPSQTLAQVRKKKGSGKDLSVAKNMKVGNLDANPIAVSAPKSRFRWSFIEDVLSVIQIALEAPLDTKHHVINLAGADIFSPRLSVAHQKIYRFQEQN